MSTMSSDHVNIPRCAQLRFKSLLLQELLLSEIHYQTQSPRWLRYHPSEASWQLYRARRDVHTSLTQYPPGVWQLLSSRSRYTSKACFAFVIIMLSSFCGRMRLRIVASSTLFARSCALRLLFVPIVERAPAWRTVWKWWWRHLVCIEDFLHEQDELFYRTGIQKLQKRLIKCTEVHGDYVEK